ncbi:MAG: hypothetical protein ABJN26_27405 [Stappiaceae bacterium]
MPFSLLFVRPIAATYLGQVSTFSFLDIITATPRSTDRKPPLHQTHLASAYSQVCEDRLNPEIVIAKQSTY